MKPEGPRVVRASVGPGRAVLTQPRRALWAWVRCRVCFSSGRGPGWCLWRGQGTGGGKGQALWFDGLRPAPRRLAATGWGAGRAETRRGLGRPRPNADLQPASVQRPVDAPRVKESVRGVIWGWGAGGVFGPTCGAGPAPGPRSWTPEPPRSPGAPLTAAPLTRSGSASRAGLVWPAGPASPEGADEPRGPPGGHHQHDGRPCGASSPPPPRVPRPPPALTSSCVGPARSPGGTPFLPGGQQVGPGVTSELRVLPAPPPVLLS